MGVDKCRIHVHGRVAFADIIGKATPEEIKVSFKEITAPNGFVVAKANTISLHPSPSIRYERGDPVEQPDKIIFTGERDGTRVFAMKADFKRSSPPQWDPQADQHTSKKEFDLAVQGKVMKRVDRKDFMAMVGKWLEANVELIVSNGKHIYYEELPEEMREGIDYLVGQGLGNKHMGLDTISEYGGRSNEWLFIEDDGLHVNPYDDGSPMSVARLQKFFIPQYIRTRL
jgi:hypothetical protein